MHIKIFGIQRTGTNYLGFLVGRNIIVRKTPIMLRDVGCLQNEPGWKHGPIPYVNDIDAALRKAASNIAIILIKNPYTWYTSIVKWTNGTKKYNYDGFGGQTPEHVFKRYNNLYEKHRKFLLGENKHTVYTDGVLIRYEDLILEPKNEIYRVAKKFNLSVKDEFKDIKKVAQSKKFTDERRSYYLAQKPTYEKDLVKRVGDSVDWELMKFYKYERLGIDNDT